MRLFRKWGAPLLFLSVTFVYAAGAAPVPMPGKRVATTQRYTMEVESVDYPSGTMVLRGHGFKKMTIHVDKKAHNLRKIHPGDWLEVVEHEEVVIQSAKRGMPRIDESTHRVAGPKSKLPTLHVEEVSRVTTKVVAIDRAIRTITLEGPTGKRHTVHVKPGVAHFENLHVGDTVTATVRKIIDMRIRKMH